MIARCPMNFKPTGVDLVTGDISTSSNTYRGAEAIASKYPAIFFPSGWKANIRGVVFSNFHTI
jgi:hypothetical protein